MEYFYRWQRQRHNILMDDGEPSGGQWNFDADNRQSFGRDGPPPVPSPRRFPPDTLTAGVVDAGQPALCRPSGRTGSLCLAGDGGRYRSGARRFHPLPPACLWRDAMWQGEPFLWHSLLSVALNLKLISPRRVIEGAIAAWQRGRGGAAGGRGFVRQIHRLA